MGNAGNAAGTQTVLGNGLCRECRLGADAVRREASAFDGEQGRVLDELP